MSAEARVTAKAHTSFLPIPARIWGPGLGMALASSWQFQSQRGTVSVDFQPRLQADDNLKPLYAVRSGLGLALLPLYFVRDVLATGKLVEVMPEFKPQKNFFKAYVPRLRMRVARVRALIDWLTVNWLRKTRRMRR